MTEPTKRWQRNEAAQNAPRTIEQFRPLIGKMTAKFMRRVEAIGAPLDAEDIQQELAITFLRCKESYRDDGGASFMNFFIQSGYHNLQRLIDREERRVKHTGYARVLRGDQSALEDEDAPGMWDIIAGHDPRPEEYLIANDLMRRLEDIADPVARTVAAILLEPPAFVVEQFYAWRLGMAERRAKGQEGDKRTSAEIDIHFVARLLGLSRSDVVRVQRELARAI